MSLEAKQEAALRLAAKIQEERGRLADLDQEISALQSARAAVQRELDRLEGEFRGHLQGSASTFRQRIVDFLHSRPCVAVPLEHIMSAVGSTKPNSIRTALYRLEKAGLVVRDEAGLYAARR